MDHVTVNTENLKMNPVLQNPKKQLAVCIKDAYKNYGSKKKPVVVLDGLNMIVPKGIIYGLLGASGCGKTTLLSCIVGRRRLNSGSIWVLGSTSCNIPSSKLGYMPQEIALYVEFTIRETLMFFGWLTGMTKAEIDERLNYLVKLLVLPNPDTPVKLLSGGQQRRVSLAAALLHEPELLILDEPTVGLDSILRESIWNHFLKITKECGTTVIITTHYIDETRQANRIALMRGGYFLAETSPTKLLNKFGLDSLESVFLKLSVIQNTNAQRRLSKAADLADVYDIMARRRSSVGVVNDGFLLEEEDVESGGKLPKSKAVVAPEVIPENQYKKNQFIINNNHLKALLWKNFSWILRNVPIMIVALALPFLQGVLFCFGVGRDPTNLSVAVTNYETNNNRNCSYNMTCDSIHLSCHYLEYLKKRDVNLVYYESEEAARESVLQAHHYASIVIKHNYTSSLKVRLDSWNEARIWDVYNSEIAVFRDVADKFIAQFLQIVLFGSFKEFIDDYLIKCDIETRWLTSPLKWETPVYGSSLPDFTEFAAPGVILTFTSFLGMGLTAMAMLLERKEGILERLLVSGTNEVEILLSHGLCQFVIMVMQSAVTLICLFAIFDITVVGSFSLVILLTLMAGLFGMCFGLLISCTCDSEVPASYAAMGSYLPMLMLGGICWPIEGMHYILQMAVAVLPFTQPTESLRSVMQRGWGLTEATVYKGFLVLGIWIIIILTLSMLVLKYKKS